MSREADGCQENGPLTSREVIARIAGKIVHVHGEGVYGMGKRDRETRPQSVDLKTFIDLLATGEMQVAMFEAYLNPAALLNQADLVTEFEEALAALELPPEIREKIREDDEKTRAMMLAAFQMGKEIARQLPPEGEIYFSPHNLSRDAVGKTDFDRFEKLAPGAQKELKGKFEAGFPCLTFEEYLVALKAALGDRQIVISLRRDRLESDYLQFSKPKEAEKFLDQLVQLQKAGLIAGIDISGVETQLEINKMTKFIRAAKKKGINLYSAHAGEVYPQHALSGLDNVLTASREGFAQIGHGTILFYLLAAQYDQDILRILDRQRGGFASLAQKFGWPLPQNWCYRDLARLAFQGIVENGQTISVCLGANLFTVVADDYFRTEPLSGKISFAEKFRQHPLVVFLIRKGPGAMKYLPEEIFRFGVDDPVATGYSLEEELSLLVKNLRENCWDEENVIRLFLHLTPDFRKPMVSS